MSITRAISTASRPQTIAEPAAPTGASTAQRPAAMAKGSWPWQPQWRLDSDTHRVMHNPGLISRAQQGHTLTPIVGRDDDARILEPYLLLRVPCGTPSHLHPVIRALENLPLIEDELWGHVVEENARVMPCIELGKHEVLHRITLQLERLLGPEKVFFTNSVWPMPFGPSRTRNFFWCQWPRPYNDSHLSTSAMRAEGDRLVGSTPSCERLRSVSAA